MSGGYTKLPAETQEQLGHHMASIVELLGGGAVFMIHRSSEGGFALAGQHGSHILEALEALGGGVASIGVTMRSETLQGLGVTVASIARAARVDTEARAAEARGRAS